MAAVTDDASSRPPRPRPSYGLPGPTPAPEGTTPMGSPDAPGAAGSPIGSGSDALGETATSDPAPQGIPTQNGTGPSWTPAGGASTASGGITASGARPAAPRRRAVLPLVLGFLSLALSVVAVIVGLLVGAGSMMGVITSGLTPVAGPTTVQAESGQMYLVYVPEGSATTCTAAGETPDAAATVPATVGSAPLGPNGETYEPVLGVQASESTAITITCTGEDAGYMGPVDGGSALLPFGIGFLVGTVLGVLGLVLIIVGIIRLVRSRRA